MIVVIPTAGSNLQSIAAACERLGFYPSFSEDPEVIKAADRVILPGVGHARAMMEKLRQKGLDQVIPGLEQPVLGICLGMQILFEHSEEGDTPGLNIIPGRIRAIPDTRLTLPHMGWNLVSCDREEALSLRAKDQFFYFVHSYMADIGPWTVATADYGCQISAMIHWRNFYGTQFHPERSGDAGAEILKEFLCQN